MTREEEIKVLEESKRQNEVMRDNPNTFYKTSDIVDGMKNAQKRIDAIQMAISALREQEERRWIPVTDRLPQNYISVLVYTPKAGLLPMVHEAYMGDDGEWHSSVFYGIENEDVTHFMPMPEPPKEVPENETL